MENLGDIVEVALFDRYALCACQCHACVWSILVNCTAFFTDCMACKLININQKMQANETVIAVFIQIADVNSQSHIN